jgi:predicted glycosyltransferase
MICEALKEVHTVAERMALKLVQVLSPAEIDDEEFAEVLRALGSKLDMNDVILTLPSTGQVARTGYEIILMERLDKEQGKKITSCTQSLLKLGEFC